MEKCDDTYTGDWLDRHFEYVNRVYVDWWCMGFKAVINCFKRSLRRRRLNDLRFADPGAEPSSGDVAGFFRGCQDLDGRPWSSPHFQNNKL